MDRFDMHPMHVGMVLNALVATGLDLPSASVAPTGTAAGQATGDAAEGFHLFTRRFMTFYHILRALVRRHCTALSGSIAVYLQAVGLMVGQLHQWVRTVEAAADMQSKVARLVGNMARLYEEFCQYAIKWAGKYLPYLVADAVRAGAVCALPPALRYKLYQGLFVVLDKMGEHEEKLIQETMQPSHRVVLKNLYGVYRRDHKYKGTNDGGAS